MITDEQITKVIDKFFHEHRAAWDEIIRIEKIADIQERKRQALVLFNTELLPHFKQEEETLLSEREFPQYSEDKERGQILGEHSQTYKIISELEANRNVGDNLSKFFPLMKSHIKFEDKYFSRIQRELIEKLRNHSNRVRKIVPIAIILIIIVVIFFLVKNETFV